MSLQLPPERDLPNPDAMFQRILADGARPEVDSLDQRRRRRTWLLPAVAAAVVLVVGVGVLLRDPAPNDSAVPPAAAPTVSNPITTVESASGQTPATSLPGPGTLVIDGVKLTVTKGADTRASITAEITACAIDDELHILNLGQWSLAGSTNAPVGTLSQLELSQGQCKAWRVQFVTNTRPATFVFTSGDEAVSWTLS